MLSERTRPRSPHFIRAEEVTPPLGAKKLKPGFIWVRNLFVDEVAPGVSQAYWTTPRPIQRRVEAVAAE